MPYKDLKLHSSDGVELSVGKIKLIRCPTLIVHSRDDRLIPFHHAQSLYEALTVKKVFSAAGVAKKEWACSF